MDWATLIGPAVVAAIVSGAISLVSAVVSARSNRTMHSERLKADVELAERKYLHERSLADWKRKIELAEIVLAGFYKARIIFKSARSPFSMGDDGSSRPKKPNETEDEARSRNAIYTPYERLHKEIDFLTELNAHRYRFAALFGSESDSAFIALISAFNEVQYATGVLLNDKSARHDRTLKFEAVIGWCTEENDPIAPRIEEAVRSIEKLCKPVLSGQP